MKKRKMLSVAIAALLAIAPIGASVANVGNNTNIVQASRRHVSRRTYYTHSRNWVTKHFYDRSTGRRSWMRMHSSPAWQKEFKYNTAKYDKLNGIYDSRAFNYNNPDIVQQLNAVNAEDHRTLFLSSHATIYVSHYGYQNRNSNYESFRRDVMKAAKMWAPAFHFTITDNPQDANVVVIWNFRPNKNAVAENVDFSELHKQVTLYYSTFLSSGYDDYGLVYLVAHELGHAIGLMHDTNLDSVMSDDTTEYEPVNYEKLRHYQAPRVTAANQRVVRELYNEN